MDDRQVIARIDALIEEEHELHARHPDGLDAARVRPCLDADFDAACRPFAPVDALAALREPLGRACARRALASRVLLLPAAFELR